MSILANPNSIQNAFSMFSASLGVVIAVAITFKPMLVGMLQSLQLRFNPRLALEQRKSQRTMQSMLAIKRLAQDVDQSQPNQAAELRVLASRG